MKYNPSFDRAGLGNRLVIIRAASSTSGRAKNHISISHRYRYALNAFATPLPPGIIGKLQHDKRVIAVEADGIDNVCDQTIPPGITRIGFIELSQRHN